MQTLGLAIVAVLAILAIAARVLWAADWLPPPRHWSAGRRALVWTVFAVGTAAVVLFAVALSSMERRAQEEASLDARSSALVGEYIDPSQSPASLRLTLSENGCFELFSYDGRHESRDPADSLLAAGGWESSDDAVTLTTDEWEVVLARGRVGVAVPDRADTLDGLVWRSGSVSTSLDAVRFVQRSQFETFLHPPEGSGASTGGL